MIGLYGPAQVGKDTVAQILIEEHGYQRMAFADPVREGLYAMNPKLTSTLRLAQLVDNMGWELAKKNPEVRHLLQRYGTEAGRDIFGQDCWIKLAATKVTQAGFRPVVFTDVRFQNEADFIHACGGAVWKILRPGVGAVNDHISDNTMIESDYVINNDAGIGELGDLVQIAIQGT